MKSGESKKTSKPSTSDAQPTGEHEQLRADAQLLAQAINTHTGGWPFTLCKGEAADAYRLITGTAPAQSQDPQG